MKAYSGSMPCVLSICASLVMAAGCAGPQANSPVSSRFNPATAAPGGLGGEGSGMASYAKTHDLLYVSHYKDGSLYVYSYPGGELKGRLLGVRADGLCADKNGHVFVLEENEIHKYAHGGTRPIAVLRNSLGGVSQFCAVDPATGNLAVSGGAYPESGVAIYPGGKANPRIYRAAAVNGRYWSCAYDNEGNLFVEGTTRNLGAAVNLVELPKGAPRFRNVTWGGMRPPRLGSIQWDGQHLAAVSPGSGSAPTILFRYAVNAGRAAVVGETPLKGAGSPLQISIHAGKVVVPNQGVERAGSAGVMLYAYPVGGSPAQVIKDARAGAATVSVASEPKFAVITYHYDNLRTGWNNSESSLSYKNVRNGSFGLLHTATVDDQVDAQPLIVPDETTTRGVDPGEHDVVYVATENDTVYAIDASSGTVLFDQNLGTPVSTPLGCNNNGPNVGINGTPVVDLTANVMYVIAYVSESGTPTYIVHELNLADLTDAVAPVVVSASHTLTNGYTYTFNATYQRQRPGLLEANGNIYAGFGSFCDFSASASRGWLLGWQAGSLTPLAANRLNDSLATSPDDFFLSSIWMSGYGVAADPSGNVYFVTGNSDPSTYNGVTNVQESVVKVSSDLTTLLSLFTPSDVGQLDKGDVDFGAGGVLLLPMPTASFPPLAAAAGKNGTMFLLSQNNLGGYTAGGPNNDVDAKQIGGCWCGESYFDAAKDSLPRIVASGGNRLTVWKVRTSPKTKLVLAGSSSGLPDGQDPGFFTTVSSAGAEPGAIIWAVARPEGSPGTVTLFAFKSEAGRGSTLDILFQAPAGPWPSLTANADLVPVVANGKVYVASYEQLDIFGIGSTFEKAATTRTSHAAIGAPHDVTGTLIAIRGSILTLRTRTGKIARVDDSAAVRHERSADLIAGEPFNVRGTYDASGVLHAAAIVRAKPSQATWPPDR